MNQIEKVAEAIAMTWRGIEVNDLHRMQARAALQSLLPPDEGTVEAMVAQELPALMRQGGLAGLPTDGPSTKRQIAESAARVTKIFTSGINHILAEGTET